MAAGEPVVELETEKIDLEVGAEHAGVLTEDRAPGGRGREGRRGARRGRSAGSAPADAPATPAADSAASTAGSGAARCCGRAGCREGARHAHRAPRRRSARRQALGGRRQRRGRPHHQARCGRTSRARTERDARRPSLRQKPAPARPPSRRPRPPRPCRRSRAEERVRMSQAAADHRAEPRRGAAHGRHADHVQRGRHERGDGPARAAQAGVQGALRRRPRHRLVLRQGQRRRAQGLPPPERGDPGRGDGPQALLRHRHRRGRAAGARRARPAQRRAHDLRRDRAGDSRVRRQGLERHVDARGPARRHVHDYQRRRLRVAAQHAHSQSAAGRHPRAAQDRGAAHRRRTARSWSAR